MITPFNRIIVVVVGLAGIWHSGDAAGGPAVGARSGELRHEIVAGADGELVAHNPGQRWCARFDGRGFMVTPEAGGWVWGLELARYGFAGAERGVGGKATVRRDGHRLDYDWGPDIREWFVNDARGLEQGWTIRRRPAGAEAGSPLKMVLSVRGDLGPEVTARGDAAIFRDPGGARVLDFGGLRAWDADGSVLPVWFEVVGEDREWLVVFVDERGARYPVTVDPVAQQAYMKASNTEWGDRFGWATAASGATVAIGAANEDGGATEVNGNQGDNSMPEAGAVYVLVREGTNWSQQAYIKASNTESNDYFGWSVALSGDTLVVGAGYEDSGATGVNGDQGDNGADRAGAVYVFVREGTNWSQQAYLKPSNTIADHRFGWSVAISGDTIVAGAVGDPSNATGVNGDDSSTGAPYSGAAYVFVREGTNWSQQAYLKASNTEQYDLFGGRVAISGDTIIVGAQEEDSAATGVNGEQYSGDAAESGAAYVFVREGTNWSQQAYLKASNTDAGDSFGGAVAIAGDTVAVGAGGERSGASGVNGDQDDDSVEYAGAAYVFVREGTNWSQQAYLKASNTDTNDRFARVAIAGDTLVVTADSEASAATGIGGDQDDNSQSDAGAAYVFAREGTNWTQVAYVKASNTPRCRYFGGGGSGMPVAMSPGEILIGAYAENSAATGVNGDQYSVSYVYDAGAAYLFTVGEAEIAVEQPLGAEVPDGGARDFGMLMPGESSNLTFMIWNAGTLDLTGLAVSKDGANAADFVVTSDPTAPVAPGSNTAFAVAFQPSSTGAKTAVVHIASNDADENPFDVTLTGLCLSLQEDTDGDGLNDVAEFEMSDLGFNWRVANSNLVSTYFSTAHLAGLYSEGDFRAVYVGVPLVAVSNGSVTIEFQLQKSDDLQEWLPFGDPVRWSEPAGDKSFYRIFFDEGAQP